MIPQQESDFNLNHLKLYYGSLLSLPVFSFDVIWTVFRTGFDSSTLSLLVSPGKLFPFADLVRWVSYGNGNITKCFASDGTFLILSSRITCVYSRTNKLIFVFNPSKIIVSFLFLSYRIGTHMAPFVIFVNGQS